MYLSRQFSLADTIVFLDWYIEEHPDDAVPPTFSNSKRNPSPNYLRSARHWVVANYIDFKLENILRNV